MTVAFFNLIVTHQDLIADVTISDLYSINIQTVVQALRL